MPQSLLLLSLTLLCLAAASPEKESLESPAENILETKQEDSELKRDERDADGNCKEECKKKNKSDSEKKKCRQCRKERKIKKSGNNRGKTRKNGSGRNNPCKEECKNKKKSPSALEECKACREKNKLKSGGNRSGNKNGKTQTKKNGKGKKKVMKKTGKSKGKNNMDQKHPATECLTNAVLITKFMKDNVMNFIRRKTRMDKQNELLDKKIEKKGDFAQAAVRLIEAGGGNKSTLTCTGSQTNVGAGNMLTLTNTLSDCKQGVIDSCTMVTTATEQAMLDACEAKGRAFNTSVHACIEMAKDGDPGACDCYGDPALMATKEELRKCKGKVEAKATAKQRTECVNKVKDCKTAAINAGVLQYACALTETEMLKTLKTLTANEAAVSSLMSAVSSLTGVANPNTGSSSRLRRNSGDKPSELLLPRQRGLRQKRETTCSSVSTTVSDCTTLISESPGSSTIVSVCAVSTTTTVTCTSTELTALESSLASLEEQRLVLVVTILSVQIQLLEVSGATAGPDAIANAGSTARMMRRNLEMLRKRIRDKLAKKN